MKHEGTYRQMATIRTSKHNTVFEYGPFIPLAVSNVTVTFDMLLLSNSLLTKFQDTCSHFFCNQQQQQVFGISFIHLGQITRNAY